MSAPPKLDLGGVIHLNVGGTRFSTSRQTLTSPLSSYISPGGSGAGGHHAYGHPLSSSSSSSGSDDTFFTALLSGRISSTQDADGAIFIDRDPLLFRVILNYLRTRTLTLSDGTDLRALLHEAEFYGLTPLVRQLTLCLEVGQSGGCGDVLFYTYLSPPLIPTPEQQQPRPTPKPKPAVPPRAGHSRNPSLTSNNGAAAGVGAVPPPSRGHSRNNSLNGPPAPPRPRNAAGAAAVLPTHSRNSSVDLRSQYNPYPGQDPMGLLFGGSSSAPHPWYVDPLRVQIVTAHQNCIAVAYPHFVACFKQRENNGFQPVFTSPYLEQRVDRIALNAKMGSVLPPAPPPTAAAAAAAAGGGDQVGTMLAIACQQSVRLMGFTEDGQRIDVGTFNLHAAVDHLFFIGTQLVALSPTGKIGVWNSMTQHWQTQEVSPITSHDTAGSFLLLGSSNGSINYIDMQKFPLRMKDNDLLVTELYHDPAGDPVTAISVYLTPKTSICGNWIEIAYGTSSGVVRVIVQHPETVGHGPQLFQTFSVHRSPVTRVKLSEKFLVSMCSEYSHVRTWLVTRFRGMISTQPGSTSVASFKIVSLEEAEPGGSHSAHNDCGPYGEQDDEQVFVQKVVPETDSLYVRLASDGRRVCVIRSVDGTTVTSFCVHECEGSTRIGSRPRRFIITGHSCGAVQMWDLTTALEFFHKDQPTTHSEGGLTPDELMKMLDHCELSNSRASTPAAGGVGVVSPTSAAAALAAQQQAAVRVKAANLAFLNSSSQENAD